MILAVTLEGLTQAEMARAYEVSEATVSRWLAGIDRRRRRVRTSITTPHSSPIKGSRCRNTVDREPARRAHCGEALTPGRTRSNGTSSTPARTVSVSTIRRRLARRRVDEPEPEEDDRSRAYIRFEADLPNETWQSDFTHWRLTNGADTEVLSWLDDHSRYALSVTAHQPSQRRHRRRHVRPYRR